MTSSASGSRPSQLVPLAQRSAYLQALRVGFSLVAVLAAATGTVDVPVGEVAPLAFLYLMTCFALEMLRKATKRRGLWLLGMSLLIDGLYLAWLMYSTGGTSSPLRFLIYLHLIGVTLLASYRTGLKIALWHSLLFFVVFYAQAAGILELRDAVPRDIVRGGVRFHEGAVFNVTVFWLVALATATFSSLNERELRRRHGDLELLAAMSTELDSAPDARAIAGILLRTVTEAFGFSRGVVLAAPQGDVSMLAHNGPVVIDEATPGLDDVVKEAWRAREPVLVRELNAESDPQLTSLLPSARRVVVVPLMAEDYPLGALVVESGNRMKTAIQRRVLSMLGQLASHAALGLRNVWLLEEVQAMAETDPLTALANRRTFDRILQHEFSRALREGGQVSLVILDLDRFKDFNDTYGHQAGDHLLQNVALSLQRASRDYETVSRYGGEEFAVILPDCSWNASLRVAERLRDAVSRVKAPCPVTASAGVATFPIQAETPEELIKAADDALYESKSAGRDRATRSTARATLDLEALASAAREEPPRPSRSQRRTPSAAAVHGKKH